VRSWAAIAAVVDALRAEGLRAATRPADVTPPVVYVRRWGGHDRGLLADPTTTVLEVWWIPVRGAPDPQADADAADQIRDALAPLVTAPLDDQLTTLSLNEQTWPGIRFEAEL
jgi:hypothetical protein